MKKNKLTPGANLLWESSRMMLPEHKEALWQSVLEHNRVQKPNLDEQELMEMGRTIEEAFSSKSYLSISIYHPMKQKQIKGKIRKLDHYFRRIQIETTEGELIWISADEIIHVVLL